MLTKIISQINYHMKYVLSNYMLRSAFIFYEILKTILWLNYKNKLIYIYIIK